MCPFLEPNTNAQIVAFSSHVTCTALICARVCTQLLQTLAQSLIGSPGTPDEGIRRGLGLPFRDCARSCNNCDSRRLKLCAIHVTEKAIFERFYLVLGLVPFGPSINCPYAPTTLTVSTKPISGFPCKFSTIRQVIWPSPGTLCTRSVSWVPTCAVH